MAPFLEHVTGGCSVAFETYTQDTDLAPFFTGLPDEQRQSPHWGHVLRGKLTYTTAHGEETFEAGGAHYVAPGHTPSLTPGPRAPSSARPTSFSALETVTTMAAAG